MDYIRTYEAWRGSTVLGADERAELEALAGDETALRARFGGGLAFGTAGLRGVVGLGLNRMNPYTVRQATLAFGRVVLEDTLPGAAPCMCLCYDCRPSSPDLAREAAAVLAGLGIGVRMFSAPRPTPQLSFAIRQLAAAGGINITASHNPKDYNGYKAYWCTGAQLDGALADRVAAHMLAVDPLDCPPGVTFAQGCASGLITFLGGETDEAFISACLSCIRDSSVIQQSRDMKIVYTPFHGVGGYIVPRVLARAGFTRVLCEPRQIEPDGTFPTLESPNPEEPGGFALAIEYAVANGAHLIIGTDPDADRVAAVAPDENGVWTPITGNQMGGLLTHYLIQSGLRGGLLPEKTALVQTIVSGGLSKAVARAAGVKVVETFTGFRFMAQAVACLAVEGTPYLLAWEEAIGYMTGEHVRDKDGVTVALLIAEMAAFYHARGESLHDALRALWRQYGSFAEGAVSLPLSGTDTGREMANIMGGLRAQPPAAIGGTPVVRALDYLTGETVALPAGRRGSMTLGGMDVLTFELADDSVFIVRPSGTEPKIKVYIHVKGQSPALAAQTAGRYAREAAGILGLKGPKG